MVKFCGLIIVALIIYELLGETAFIFFVAFVVIASLLAFARVGD